MKAKESWKTKIRSFLNCWDRSPIIPVELLILRKPATWLKTFFAKIRPWTMNWEFHWTSSKIEVQWKIKFICPPCSVTEHCSVNVWSELKLFGETFSVVCSVHLATQQNKHRTFIQYTHALCSDFVNFSIKNLEINAKITAWKRGWKCLANVQWNVQLIWPVGTEHGVKYSVACSVACSVHLPRA